MTDYEFGDVVIVPFPFTDQSTTKRRPAVVVSSRRFNRERQDLIILAITSQVHTGKAAGEAEILRWKEAGLLKPSVFKPILATIEKGLVPRRIGRLTEEDRRTLDEALGAILGRHQPD